MLKSFISTMNGAEVLRYYSREDVQNAILKFAKDKEIVGSLEDGSFLKRPDILMYPKDIEEKVKKGVVAFHCSVENWYNPMQLSTGISQKDMEAMRKGFDLIIDIDSKSKLSHGLIAAGVIFNFLKDLGVKPTMKFSGRRGIHLGIASNAFPQTIDFNKISSRYPELLQTLAEFIREKAKEQMLEEMINFEGGVGALVNTMPSVSELSPYSFIELEKGWSNRHLFRMPYSLHPAQWLVSVPIKIENLKNFKPEDARPGNVRTDAEFLVNKDGEATELLLQAMEWKSKQPREAVRKAVIGPRYEKLIPEDFFPPCIKLILNGLGDGKKRSLFTLLTYLRNMNWTQDEIEKKIREWNAKNATPLTERFLSTQLKWHFRQSRMMLPANCSTGLFYEDMGVCKPDQTCGLLKNVKNPIKYPLRVMKRMSVNSDEKYQNQRGFKNKRQ
ncbi:MAG: DNA primase small subunit domain-containing protein [Candidatus Aenigmatarchaeota archaeon]